MFATASFAAFFVEGRGEYVDYGYLKTQFGYAGGFGFSLTNRLNLLFRYADQRRFLL